MPPPSAELGKSLRYSVEVRDGVTCVALKGHISEAANFTALKQLPRQLTIDLSEISRINSIGVREWSTFVRECELAGMDLTFERCSPAIVSQMGMISNFMGMRSRVKSVLVPYLCTSCKFELLDVLELVARMPVKVAPTLRCPSCQDMMELDDLEETYTALVAR